MGLGSGCVAGHDAPHLLADLDGSGEDRSSWNDAEDTPDAVIHSPAEMMAAWPITVTSSRWPRAFARSTQKPLSLLWNVTRSTRPARTSWVNGACGGFIDAASAGASPNRVDWMDEVVVTGWKTTFDGDPVGREMSGLSRYRILRPNR
jgi:hypothetical protein